MQKPVAVWTKFLTRLAKELQTNQSTLALLYPLFTNNILGSNVRLPNYSMLRAVTCLVSA